MEMTAKDTSAFAQMQKNTVHSDHQLDGTEELHFGDQGSHGFRVLFLGNSITLHGVKEDIGWHGCWGMAASEKEKDYVHLLMKMISEKRPDAVFQICQAADWERNYKTGTETYPQYEEARDFEADMIIMRLIENCPGDAFDQSLFEEQLERFLDYLNPTGNAQIIMTTGFWRHPGDEGIRNLAKKKNWPLAELGDLGEDDAMKAIGLFEHNGVANHPGDLGMQKIAERIWNSCFTM